MDISGARIQNQICFYGPKPATQFKSSQTLNATAILPHKFTESHIVTLGWIEVEHFWFENV